MTTTGGYFVDRTVGALELLSHGPRSTVAIAESLQIHERTARRTLVRLTEAGYIARANGTFGPHVLTDRIPALGIRALLTRNLTEPHTLDNAGCVVLIVPLTSDPAVVTRAGR